jgi:quinol monooxygenase YgiN
MNIIIRRQLKDYETWKKVVSQLDGMRKEYGSKGLTVYRNASKPDEVILVFDWDDRKPYQNYLNHPEVQKTLKETGTLEVIEVSDTFHLEE